MSTTWKEVRSRRVGPRDEERIAEVRDQMEAELWLADLRRHRKVRQASVAKSLACKQPQVSRLERSPRDSKLSTIARYVDALGGELELRAVFPDETVLLKADEIPGFGKFSIASAKARGKVRIGSAKATGKTRMASSKATGKTRVAASAKRSPRATRSAQTKRSKRSP